MAGDLEWAQALLARDAEAIARYEREIVPVVTAQLRRRGHTHDQIQDLQQILRTRLLVDGSIASYAGTGKLSSFVLVAAMREAVRSRERSKREPAIEEDALIALADRGDSSSIAPEKARYREAFRVAFRAALASLEPRDRTILRMHLIDALSIDQVGQLLGVHRATAARWITSAREAIATAVRRDLAAQLGTDRFEAEEVMRWIQSRIELSLSGLATLSPK